MDNNTLVTVVLIAVVAAVLAVLIVMVVRRRRWIKALHERGWTFVNTPRLESTLTLVGPPFGQGFERRVDDQITGRAGPDEVPFQVLEYHGGHYDGHLAVLRLALPLPELYVFGGDTVRTDIHAATHPHPDWQVLTTDHQFADAVLPALDGPLRTLAEVLPVDLSVDGTDLVALGAPKDPEELDRVLPALAAVVAALDALDLERFAQPEPERRFRFHARPDWVFHGDDQAFLNRVTRTRAGFGHRVADVLTGDHQGLPFIALRHRWKTRHTTTVSNGRGGTRTQTVIRHHDEDLFEMRLPTPVPLLSVGEGGWGWFSPGAKVELESADFNRTFAVRAGVEKFAYDVLHPRQMEFLLAHRPAAFRMEDTTLTCSSRHDAEWIGREVDVLSGFLARVPGWVWKDLGLSADPPFTRPELG